ncbi:MAG: peptidase M50 [Pseudorhodobacter sp.]
MSASFHSQVWYRVRALKPALKPGLEIALHSYLGRKWFVLRDPVGGTVHRFTAEAYAIIGAMDGVADLGAIWQATLDRLGPQAPSQDEVLNLMIQLYQADLVLVDVVPLAEELVERMGRKRARKRGRFFRNPMSVPVPLGNPDRMLDALAPLVRGRAGLVWLGLWLLVVGAAAVVLPASWQDLTSGGVREILALENLALMALVYPVVKMLHELAHGLAVKRHGGECHEIGVMFLVFFPVPYVDASSSAAFPDKWARALVGAAGILAEVAIAAAALLIWKAAEPGLLRDLAFNAMLISGFSTVVVNGNPLLKFDGYFVLSDLIEIPNLAARSSKWWGDLVRRRLLSAPDPDARPPTRFEARVFAVYAPAAFVYRLVVMVGIALYVIESYFVVGLLLALWSVTQGLVIPTGKALKPLFTDPRLMERHGRAAGIAGALALCLGLGLFVVPLPLRATLEGVVWLPDQAALRTGAAGFVRHLPLRSGSAVADGMAVAWLHNADLEAERAAQAARLAEAVLEGRLAAVRDRSAIRIADETEAEARRRLAELDRRIAALTVHAGIGGRLSITDADDQIGRYLDQGAVLGHVLPPRAETVRAVAPQHLAELLQGRLRGVELRLIGGGTGPVEITRLAPSATRTLPAPALSRAAGGAIATDPTDPEGLRAVDPFFELDLRLPETLQDPLFGTRAIVKLDFGSEPVGYRLGRALRRAFLRHFGNV